MHLHKKIQVLFIATTLLVSPFFASAYTPGETMNPTCGPTDPGCDVVIGSQTGSYTASGEGLHLDSGSGQLSIVLDGSTLSQSASGLKVSAVGSSQITDGTIVNGDISLSAAIAYSKLNLSSSLVNSDISSSAAIDWSKISKVGATLLDVGMPLYTGNAGKMLVVNGGETGVSWVSALSAALADGKIFVGNASGTASAVTLSNDAIISNTGVFTIANNAVALKTDTTGNYVTSIANTTGTGITGGNGGSEGAELTLSLDINGLATAPTIDDADTVAIYDASDAAVRKITRSDFLSGITGALIYKGTWDATNNSPTLSDATGVQGNYYVASEAGTRNFGSGAITFAVGDWAVFNGTAWQKLVSNNSVSSVFGRSGSVVASTGDYNAIQITNATSGNIAATNVQAALNELDAEKFGSGTKLTDLDVPSYTGNAGKMLVVNATSSGVVWASALTTTLASGNIFVGNGSGVATAAALSGDATISNTGALAIVADAVELGTETTGNYVAGATSNSGLTLSGTEGGTLGIALNGATLSLGASGLSLNVANANTWSATQTFSNAIVAPTSADTINGLIINAGAISGATGATFAGGSSISSLGALSMTTASNGALSLTSNGTGAVTLDSGTTGAINIGTGASAKTITIGNTTGATGITLNSGTAGMTANSTVTTGTALQINANSLTTGSGLSLTSSYAAGNSTNGLLYVANTGAVTNGIVGRIQSNSTAGSGLTVLANGNVGIGTTNPTATLDVAGTISTSDGTHGYMTMNSDAADRVGFIEWKLGNGTRLGFMGDGASDITLALENGADFTVNGGNVGIGMTDPSEKLDVYGVAMFETANGAIRFSPSAGVNYIQSGATTANDSTQDLNFGPMKSTATWMRIDGPTGNVGIGTASPANKLQVVGGGIRIDNDQRMYFGTNGTSYGSITYEYADTNLVIRNGNSGGVYLNDVGATAWTAVSDKRLKQGITALDSSILDKVLALNPVTYYWKTGEDTKEQVGFIAQEVLATGLTDVVSIPDDPTKCDESTGKNCYGLKYEHFAPYLVKAIQEQQKLIVDLQSKVGVSMETLNGMAVSGALSVAGHVALGSDTVGEVTVSANNLSTIVNFTTAYTEKPAITVTPEAQVTGTYWVDSITENGFAIKMSQAQSSDVSFSWHAFAQKGKAFTAVSEAPQQVSGSQTTGGGNEITCDAPQVLNETGDGCVDPAPTVLVCTDPQVLNATGDACVDSAPSTPVALVCTDPQILNEAGDACVSPTPVEPVVESSQTGENDEADSLTETQ